MLVTWFEDESTQRGRASLRASRSRPPSQVRDRAARCRWWGGSSLGGAGTRRTLRGACAPAVAPRRRDARVRPGGVARRDGARRAVRPGQPLPAPPIAGGGRLVRSRWRDDLPGRVKRTYELTDDGRAALDGMGRAPSTSCPTPSPPSGGATRKEARDASQHPSPHPSSSLHRDPTAAREVGPGGLAGAAVAATTTSMRSSPSSRSASATSSRPRPTSPPRSSG